MSATTLVLLFLLLVVCYGAVLAQTGLLTIKSSGTTLANCSSNAKLEQFKKEAQRRFAGYARRRKRQVAFPVDCWHAATAQDSDGSYYVIYDLQECCEACSHPAYTLCILSNPEWLCASEAYGCVCGCQATHGSGSLGVVRAKASSVTPPKNLQSLCRKTRCNAQGQCCLENVCVPLKSVKKKLTKD